MQTHPVRNGRNLLKIGWENGTLEAEFEGARRYHYGGVPEDVKAKLLRTCFPDAMFEELVGTRYPRQRVYRLPPSKPLPLVDFGEIPF